MAHHHQRLKAFVKLGDFLREYCEYAKNSPNILDKINPLFRDLDDKIIQAGHANGWFTRDNILFALSQWGQLLSRDRLAAWLADYKLENIRSQRVAIIMAGNIPLVGFHDFLCVLITGNDVIVKLSSNDLVLLPFIADHLITIEPSLNEAILFEKERLSEFDAIIATGSNNTARYFDYYFRDKPSIIRRNRVSVAVLKGDEDQETLRALGEDIFRFFGLGCRSVSKLFVPEDFNFDSLFKALYSYKGVIDLAKYANNYDYNKAVYLMSEFQILDNGFLLLKEDKNYGSPIATLFYERYTNLESLHATLKLHKSDLQCVVAAHILPNEVPFGQTQHPGLDDYADGVDTVEFLLKTSHN